MGGKGKKKVRKSKAQIKREKALAKRNEGKKVVESKEKKTVDEILNDGRDPEGNWIRDIIINKFSMSPLEGGENLIISTEIKFVHGHRYGLIGNNGAGKTTFLSHLSSGELKEVPKHLRLLHLKQEIDGDEHTVKETVLRSDHEREALLSEQKRLTEELSVLEADEGEKEPDETPEENQARMDRLIAVNDRLQFIEADAAETRASTVLSGLNFTDRMQNLPTKDLSGGWLMRVSLACALFLEPDVLLLDEPTNHLDFPTVIWLSEYLQTYDKILVVVSHDREFLNAVCTDIVHLDRKKFFYYKGNFDQFIKTRKELRRHQGKAYLKQQKMIKHNEAFIAKFKANKKWSTQAQSRMKMLAKVDRVDSVVADYTFNFEFPQPGPLRNPLVIHLNELTFGYYGEDKSIRGTKYLFRKVEIRVEMGTKIGILGHNGAGKSSLIKLIMQELEPVHGKCLLPNAVQVGFFAQHHVDILNLNETPLQYLKKCFPDATLQGTFAKLGRFGISQTKATKKIGLLSGGEKSRVAFAILTWENPHLLIMDEPTNHLDLATIEALQDALANFEGTCVLVSHDQRFLSGICNKFWAIGNRRIKQFGDFVKARDYCFKECKPVDCLPREFATAQVKKKAPRFKGEKFKHETDEEKAARLKKEQEETKQALQKKKKEQVVLEIDAEREIAKGIEKELTPTQILRHIKGWQPIDGDRQVIDKLCFDMFHKYYSRDYADVTPRTFFEDYAELLKYVVPTNHTKNQLALLFIAQCVWVTERKDESERAMKDGACRVTFKYLVAFKIVTPPVLTVWRDDKLDKSAGKREALEEVDEWISQIERRVAARKAQEEKKTPCVGGGLTVQ